jgi:hypothetical protein
MDYSCTGTSSCSGAPQNLGVTCDDGNAMTINDVCLADGSCLGSGACTLSAYETFDTSALPGGWSIEDFDGDAYGYDWVWNNVDNTTGGAGGYWWVDSTPYYENFDDRLYTATYNNGNCSTVNLTFNHYYNDYDTDDYGYVQISVNAGTWTTIATYSALSSGVINLSLTGYLPAPSTNFRLRFRYVGYWDYYWKVDNVQLSGT